MHPMFIVAIPLVLVIVGMVLNSIGLSFDQPPSSAEQDPAKRAAAEGEDYRRFFDRQRHQALTSRKGSASMPGCWWSPSSVLSFGCICTP